MINKIILKNIATYDSAEFFPNRINYIFGSNGTGKTTISKLIFNPQLFSSSIIEWKGNVLRTIVYNKDFVKNNFSQSNSIKGIFTLGKDTKEAKEFIESTKKEIDKLLTNIEGSKKIKKDKELLKEKLVSEFSDKCWDRKKRYEIHFSPAFKGFIASKKAFYQKCLKERNNSANLLSFEELCQKKELIFSNEKTHYDIMEEFEFDELQKFEESNILSTSIVGKSDVQIGELIKKFNNSDWVYEGSKYLKIVRDKCPFCQQSITEEITTEISNFFDSSYEERCKELKSIKDQYETYITNKIKLLRSLVEKDIKILDYTELIQKIALAEETLKVNMMKIDNKIKSPSNIVSLDSLVDCFQEVKSIIGLFRLQLKNNNDLISNITKEKEELKSQMWKYIVSDIKDEMELCIKAVENNDKAIKGIEKVIKDKEEEVRNLKFNIELKEGEITSTEHTKNEINNILKQFGFTGFKIENAGEKGTYKIIREDGTDVRETLSEGEYNFLSFLYFYQLIKGSTDKSGITGDKVIVIDDPISSLDSNVLFIVSHLIKDIISDCLEELNGFRQVFILTHNIYFYKEVSFRGNRYNKSNNEAYWLIRKLNNVSTIKEHPENPIQTSYELLWRELDDLENINKVNIFNTLRRILEYYFNIIGGISYEECINKFEGEEKLVCKSLVSWINDGSHFINDDLMVYAEPESVEKYLKVFELIFEKMGHISHYRMMRKIK